MPNQHLIITGIRGVPARHGGFETFAERLATHLVKRGWRVTVYCQEEIEAGERGAPWSDSWEGVERIHIPVRSTGAWGTIEFDLRSILRIVRTRCSGVVLTLGYNTGLFNGLLWAFRRANVINMDGLEWRRAKWRWFERLWLLLNERCAAFFGSELIGDHPEIAKYLASFARPSKVTMIPYGADQIVEADVGILSSMGLEESKFALLIARPEPENSLLEIVTAYSMRARGAPLVVLGSLSPQVEYHQRVIAAASSEVLFVGAIYEGEVVRSLRLGCRVYVHGHQVGGTNPSLVEALGAGSCVIAHDNRFNKWVAGAEALYFCNVDECDTALSEVMDMSVDIAHRRIASAVRHKTHFQWESVLANYERVLDPSYGLHLKQAGQSA